MPRLTNQITNFSGGVWRSSNQNAAANNTVRAAWNCRVGEYGDLTKRRGTEKLHDTALAAVAENVFYWDRGISTGPQFVTCVGTDFLNMVQDTETDFTSRGTLTGATSGTYKPMVAWNTGSTDRVYVSEVSGSDHSLWAWSGSLFTEITEFPGDRPAWMEVYKNRLWVNDADVDGAGKGAGIYACKVNDPTVWDTSNGALYFSVGATGSTAVTGMKAVGESLLVFKPNSIVRVTGSDSFSLNIDQDSEGVSNEVGCVHGSTIVRFGQEVFFLAAEGPYVANEGGVRYVGAAVEHWLDRRKDSAFAFTSYAAAHHAGRREIHLWVTPTDSIATDGRLGTTFESGTVATGQQIGFIWNYAADVWTGPLTLASGFGVSASTNNFNRVTAATSFKHKSGTLAGTESIVYTGFDINSTSWVMDADSPNGYQDFMDRTGGNGDAFEAVIELPEQVYGNPDYVKLLHPTQWLSADIDVASETSDAIQIRYGSEMVSSKTLDITVTPQTSSTWKEYRTRDFKFRPALRGRRPVIQIIFNNGDAYASLKGVTLTSEIGRRVA